MAFWSCFWWHFSFAGNSGIPGRYLHRQIPSWQVPLHASLFLPSLYFVYLQKAGNCSGKQFYIVGAGQVQSQTNPPPSCQALICCTIPHKFSLFRRNRVCSSIGKGYYQTHALSTLEMVVGKPGRSHVGTKMEFDVVIFGQLGCGWGRLLVFW